MRTSRESESDSHIFGLLIQRKREALGLTQEAAFLRMRDALIEGGHVRKWATDGAKWMGRLERGEAVKQPSNCEIDALCTVYNCTAKERAEIFAALRRDPFIAGNPIAEQIAAFIQARSYEMSEVMRGMIHHTIFEGCTRLSREDLEELYEDARRVIERRR